MYSGILGCNSINLLIFKKIIYKGYLKFDNKVMLVNILNDEKKYFDSVYDWVIYRIIIYFSFWDGKVDKRFCMFFG